MSEKELEEKAENVENFLEVLSKNVDLIMLNFIEINKRIENQADKIDLDKNQLFELGENIGIIKGYMKIVNKMNNVNNINKEIITEMIKNLDLFSIILIDLDKNNINLQDLEQRMLTFTDAVMEFLENTSRS
jgi:H2-forming N5,N10-methylenetetrahydromethanopterin dehydrogenase-like enzyme